MSPDSDLTFDLPVETKPITEFSFPPASLLITSLWTGNTRLQVVLWPCGMLMNEGWVVVCV